LSDILKGAADKAAEAGISILGGHTIEDNEPKFGMVVTGFVHPKEIWKNEGAKQGDLLVLSKPIGLGIMSTALKRGLLNSDQIENISSLMTSLNNRTADLLHDFNIHACTDVTGFGLLGHLMEMLKASSVGANLFMDQIPLIDGVESNAAAGVIPGGSRNNLAFVDADVEFDQSISEISKLILADAQTSGGLLFSIQPEQFPDLMERSKAKNISLFAIGEIVEKGQRLLHISQTKQQNR
jgi:selenium donor protein